MMNFRGKKIILFLLIILYSSVSIEAYGTYSSLYSSHPSNIKNINGKFYAYIVLLFNENPHFVNLIQKDTIPPRLISSEGFHIRAYKNYLSVTRDSSIKETAKILLSVYLEPDKFNRLELNSLENLLTKRNIVLKFSRDKNPELNRVVLEYCIYGKKEKIKIKHPFFTINENIYNIQPYIYYDEFSTSNSTFYYDMIFINPEEVQNDFIIAKNIKEGRNTRSMFFVGSIVNEDISYCLLRAFSDTQNIKDEIFRMFVIHELTHKIVNNRFNYYDQVTGEHLSLCSTVYANPYLGLAVMYSYLNYNAINPHRIAAMNYIKYISEKSGRGEILTKPELVKNMSSAELKKYSKMNFQHLLKKMQ